MTKFGLEDLQSQGRVRPPPSETTFSRWCGHPSHPTPVSRWQYGKQNLLKRHNIIIFFFKNNKQVIKSSTINKIVQNRFVRPKQLQLTQFFMTLLLQVVDNVQVLLPVRLCVRGAQHRTGIAALNSDTRVAAAETLWLGARPWLLWSASQVREQSHQNNNNNNHSINQIRYLLRQLYKRCYDIILC